MEPDRYPADSLPARQAAADGSLVTVGWISYLLHLVVAVAAVLPGAQVSIAILVVALVLDMVKRPDAEGTWQASHFRWRIRSVVWAAVLYMLTLPLWILIIPGWIAWSIISIWFFYRIVLGMVRMNRRQPMETSSVV